MEAFLQRLRAVPTRITDKTASSSNGWYIGESNIKGKGIFADKDYKEGESIGSGGTAGGEDEFGAKIWNLTELARYCNHQWKSNVDIKKNNDQIDLVAKREISKDQEIVADYAQVSRELGPRSRMMWNGKDVPSTDFSDYVEKNNDHEQ